MLALLDLIKTRLAAQPALAGFDVRDGYSHADRSKLPVIDVRMAGTGPGLNKGQAVMLSPVWRITVAVAPGASASADLDTAMAATIEALYGWGPPGMPGGRVWERLTLQAVTEVDYFEPGCIGYQLDFLTHAMYRGQTV